MQLSLYITKEFFKVCRIRPVLRFLKGFLYVTVEAEKLKCFRSENVCWGDIKKKVILGVKSWKESAKRQGLKRWTEQK